ncbi:MAG: asparaginase [Thermodesulfobacteriota bacterium]
MTRNEPRREVAVFFTGGTITMRPQPEEPGIAPSSDFDQLFDELGLELAGVGLRPVFWSNRPSPHMTPELMFRLAQEIDDALAEPQVIGAVVLHGTDVLVESAYLADLTIISTKPVVFTGAMRYLSELGYDGIRNLLGGIKACLLPLPPELGVVLLMTDRLFSAREVAKVHSLNIDAFEAPETGPVGYLAGDAAIVLTRRSAGPAPSFKAKQIETNVALVTCYVGMDGGLIDFLRERGVAGLVIEGFGAGNVPPAVVPSLEALLAENVPVILATRCLEGGVWPIYAYPGGAMDLERKGVIPAGRLSGPKARLLLMAALGVTRDVRHIRAIFSRLWA